MDGAPGRRRRRVGHVFGEHLLRGVDQDVGVLGLEGEVQIEPGERGLEPADRLATLVAPGDVAEAGSLAATVRRLNTPPATASRKITELEEHLRTKLFDRSARRLVLTDAGSSYVAGLAPAPPIWPYTERRPRQRTLPATTALFARVFRPLMYGPSRADRPTWRSRSVLALSFRTSSGV
jgi:hypothetical protein